ncbi:hypothetical protein SMACR_01253 [Sordaria macrospora]|uniref:WGS project CABT00000000 data, contig 2.4 n=2 Tax=Sordaria macrospora TaxID=5147 RepID=F7VQA4_SORMK|nr:uncharacterized protein SMAC_01253 [Sordaria macrospora k-hell]KAA8628606.1 hypothetical protein SMACR_01253 [Sordaria macrospora]KAH7634332.1 hypothetical protein B0T09DRAFT_3213 [Sordaria sp. MPI-SDFR-AT-0083]WPJ58867.1 hypothetical protein SMAC4_01253 [Sordaria macrospora]CCC07686.1 unnamed protein product [Sordaria macrospora k-hell]
MRPRLLLPRGELARPCSPAIHSTTTRFFTQSASVRVGTRTRPQLGFLNVPVTTQQYRYLTTERKARLKQDIKQGIKITSYLWMAGACCFAIAFALVQETLEARYPTPHEWSMLSRIFFRGAFCERDQTDPSRTTDWVHVTNWIKSVVDRLEDPGIDGKGLKDAPSDRPKGTRDISTMSENWRRGYYEAMMLYAKAAENVENWVTDKTQNLTVPNDYVIGPSNPNPRPFPNENYRPPQEDDCVPTFESPNEIYMRILSTEGLTNRQRIEAGLAYATWLEFKQITGPANIILENAVDLAASEQASLTGGQAPLDTKTYTLVNDTAGAGHHHPSSNLLQSLTALATFRARNGDVSSALPMLVSILQARKTLPSTDPRRIPSLPQKRQTWAGAALALLKEPPYPDPPEDGTLPPLRDAKERCEEAALSLHIGEIMYTAKSNTSGAAHHREEGLGWTREAVDIAEEQLRGLSNKSSAMSARLTCRECLAAGLENWTMMVSRLAREEKARKEELEKNPDLLNPKKTSWWSFWGQGEHKQEDLNRWAAEEKVIAERQRRAADLLEELPTGNRGFLSFLQA